MALYAISIRQARDLPPPFFRVCLTADTLGLSYILPAAGRIRDFHPLERALTGRTQKALSDLKPSQIALFFCCFLIGLQPVLERLHHCIAELLGRDFHIAGRFVVFRVVITPLVVVLPVDFAVAMPFGLSPAIHRQ